MGTFLALTSVIGKTKNEVIDSLANYARSVNGGLVQENNIDIETPNCCIVEEENGNTSVFYPDEYLEWDKSSQFISQELNAGVFSFHIHDGDFWMYTFFDKGEEADRFIPIPDYWDENISEEEIKSWKGNARKIASYVPYIKAGDIEKYLVRWDLDDDDPQKAYPTDEFEREDWQLIDFMRKLRLPYPLDDDENPKGDTYRFWTEQLKLETTPTKKAEKQNKESGKPWWKFW